MADPDYWRCPWCGEPRTSYMNNRRVRLHDHSACVDGLAAARDLFRDALRFVADECDWEPGRGDSRIGPAINQALVRAATQERSGTDGG